MKLLSEIDSIAIAKPLNDVAKKSTKSVIKKELDSAPDEAWTAADRFWLELNLEELETGKIHPGLLWCVGCSIQQIITGSKDLKELDAKLTKNRDNVFHFCAKVFQNRKDNNDLFVYLSKLNLFNIIRDTVTKEIIVEDAHTVSYKRFVNFDNIVLNRNLCSSTPENFKFKYMHYVGLGDLPDDSSTSSDQYTDLKDWFPEQAHNVSLTLDRIDSISSFHKILKRCSFLTISSDGPFPILWVLKLEDLKTVNLYFKDLSNKKLIDQNNKLMKIVNKYIPRGNIYDCQEELIEAGFEEFAKL